MASRQSSVSGKTSQPGSEIQPAKGKLGVMIPGMGAVATTFVAGVEAIRKGFAQPIGSLTQMGTIRLGKRTDGRSPKINEFVPLSKLNDLVFTGWDIFEDDMYSAASKAGVLEQELLGRVKPFLKTIKPMKAVFDHNYIRNIDGPNKKKGKSKMDLAEQVRDDIRKFRKSSKADRLVMVWCASTEAFLKPSEIHSSLAKFEKALTKSDAKIAPSMIYAYAALKEGVPFANGAPNLTVDIPAMLELSREMEAPDLRQGLQDWSDVDEDDSGARIQGAPPGYERMVLHQHSRQSRWGSARRSGFVQDEGRVEAVGAGIHPSARSLSAALRQHLPQGEDQLLSAARR